MDEQQFTDDELYIIERTFDYLYSRLDMDMRKCFEQLMIINATEFDILIDKKKICSELLSQAIRINESSIKHRIISEKCEEIRKRKII